MKSVNLLNNIIDEDNIILKLPTPHLTISIDGSTNTLVISGNFSMSLEISKIAYTGPSKNTTQIFSLSEIYISFNINDSENNIKYSSRYEPTNILSSSCLFVVANKYTLPNINIFNVNINSFKIIANYIYGNNKISSIISHKNNNISITYPIILHTEETEETEETKNINIRELLKTFVISKPNNTIETFSEHLDKPSSDKSSTHETAPDPFFTLYWLIPVSIVLCVIVYYYKVNTKNRKNHNHDDYDSHYDSHTESSGILYYNPR
jgi:hypothetical protein